MSKHGLVFVEDEDGDLLGTALNYDEGPKAIGEALAALDLGTVREAIEAATYRGGVRSLTVEGSFELYNDRGRRSVFKMKDVDSCTRGYVKRFDGGVDLIVDGWNGVRVELVPAPKKPVPVINEESMTVDCAQEELLGFVIRKLQARGELVQVDVDRAAKIIRGSVEFGLNAAQVTLGLK